MSYFRCEHCGSSEFIAVETELRIKTPGLFGKFIEVRQQESCCCECAWVPSESLKNTQVLRKIPVAKLLLLHN